ncbi:helix-turn-helix domain-containing protein [Roseibium sp.]
MARQELGVTAAAVDNMIRQLGPTMPRELTGCSRYRAWGIL